MNIQKLIERVLENEPAAENWPSVYKEVAKEIVRFVLEEDEVIRAALTEASVFLPKRGTKWIACFTSARGGQIWKSTGTSNRDEALAIAKGWEAAERAEKLRLGLKPRRPPLRVRSGSDIGLFSQKEVSLLLRISERAVRAAERSAIKKLRRHPAMREIWKDYFGGELEEEDFRLTATEVSALYHLATTSEELAVIDKVLSLISM